MKKKIPIKVCPECNSHLFKFDTHHRELYCSVCGLIIYAPYTTDYIRPDFKTIHIILNVPDTVKNTKEEKNSKK